MLVEWEFGFGFEVDISCILPPSANKAVYPGYETKRRRHQKSKTGVSVALQKGLMSSKFFLKSRGYFYLAV